MSDSEAPVKSYPASEIGRVLSELFDAALEADEFEYCCALLRLRGIEPASWDPLAESQTLLRQISSLSSAPLDDNLRMRLSLFLYCHATEMDDLYSVTMNMLRILEGGRCSIVPFGLPRSKSIYPSQKVDALGNLARSLGRGELASFYEWVLVREVRNAFFHSQYSILGGEFVIYRGKGVKVDGVFTRVVPFSWLIPRMEAGINLAFRVIYEILGRRERYKTAKTIRPTRAAEAGFSEVTLLVDDKGLVGFQSLVGATPSAKEG